MALILAIEPDQKQAAQLTHIARHRVHAELVLADTTERALDVIGDRVPDLVLVPALLSPQDDAALAAALKVIAAAANVRTLTIPLFASGVKRQESRGGLFGRFRREKEQRPTDGCDPAVFAEQIAEYLQSVANERTLEKEFDTAPAASTETVAALEVEAPTAALEVEEPAALEVEAPTAVPGPATLAAAPEVATPADVPLQSSPVFESVEPIEQVEQLVAEAAQPAEAAEAVAPAHALVDLSEFAAMLEPSAEAEAAAPASNEQECEDDTIEIDLSDDTLAALEEIVADEEDESPVFELTLDEDAVLVLEDVEEPEAESETVPLAASEASGDDLVGLEEFFEPEPPQRLFVPAVPKSSGLERLWPPMSGALADFVTALNQPLTIAPARIVEQVVAPPQPAPRIERPDWSALVASLRQDIERLRHDRPAASGVAATVQPPPPAKKPARSAQRPPQDEWGFFDPAQCGFAALLAKLDEITESGAETDAARPRH